MQMTDSVPVVHSATSWRKRVLLWVVLGCVLYFLTAGPVTRLAPEFADWFYAPLGLVADIPLAGSALRGWLSLWGVDVS
jgi:hypothetical protein